MSSAIFRLYQDFDFRLSTVEDASLHKRTIQNVRLGLLPIQRFFLNSVLTPSKIHLIFNPFIYLCIYFWWWATQVSNSNSVSFSSVIMFIQECLYMHTSAPPAEGRRGSHSMWVLGIKLGPPRSGWCSYLLSHLSRP